MTRSRSHTLIVVVATLGLPLFGCAQPAQRAPEPEPATQASPPAGMDAAFPDRRLDARRAIPGEDITALVREQNAPGKEPSRPTRHGRASFTASHPSLRRTAEGFVAHVPGARYVGTPAHHRGRVLVGGFGTWDIHALNAETGSTAWSLNLSDDGPTDPTCKDGICVFNTYSCTMFGVEVATGKPLWSWYLGSPQLATVVIQDDLVFSSYPHRGENPDANYVIAAFDLKTGTPKWRRWIDAEVNSTPVSDGKHLYVATTAGTLYQFGARDGQVVAAYKNRVASPPVLAGGAVIFGRDPAATADNDMLVAGRVLFPQLEMEGPRRQQAVKPQPRPLVARRGLYTIDHGLVVATDRKTGSRMWQQRFGSEEPADVPEPMLYAGKSVLLATSSGNVLRLDPETGDVLESFRFNQGAFSSQPIAVDGWLYAGTKRGDLVAFDTGQPDLTGWEMLGGSPDRHGSADEEGI